MYAVPMIIVRKQESGFIWKSYRFDDKTISPGPAAAFDLDGTLVRPSSGKVHPKNEFDWAFCFDNIEARLESLVRKGFRLLIFTNQGWEDPTKIAQFEKRVDAVVEKLKVPVDVFAAIGKKSFARKPRTLMWDFAVNTGYVSDLSKSFFVGDAAGRAQDFSDTDRTFAMNAGLKFHTPDEFFRSCQNEPFKLRLNFDDYPFSPGDDSGSPTSGMRAAEHDDVNLIICIGSPASGKSTYVERLTNHSPEWVRVNMDTMKTKKACLKAVEGLLSKRMRCILDNTNPSKETRKLYIDLAKRFNCNVKALWFTTPPAVCEHNNAYRALLNPSERVPTVAFRMYYKNFQTPDLSEGFREIVEVPFRIDPKVIEYTRYLI